MGGVVGLLGAMGSARGLGGSGTGLGGVAGLGGSGTGLGGVAGLGGSDTGFGGVAGLGGSVTGLGGVLGIFVAIKKETSQPKKRKYAIMGGSILTVCMLFWIGVLIFIALK